MNLVNVSSTGLPIAAITSLLVDPIVKVVWIGVGVGVGVEVGDGVGVAVAVVA